MEILKHTCSLFIVTLIAMVTHVKGSGSLYDPPNRAVMWKYGFYTQKNYNYMQLNCGGEKQPENGPFKCGICGDPYDLQKEHEKGGKFGSTIISRYYPAGIKEMSVKIELLAFEKGFFEFRICSADNNTVTQECLDENILPIKEGYLAGTPLRFFPQGAGDFRLTVAIPPNLTCDRCVLQWRYHTANSWGTDPNTQEQGLGFGPQEEFRNCADIRIGGPVPKSVRDNPFFAPPDQSETSSIDRPTEQRKKLASNNKTRVITPDGADRFSPAIRTLLNGVNGLREIVNTGTGSMTSGSSQITTGSVDRNLDKGKVNMQKIPDQNASGRSDTSLTVNNEQRQRASRMNLMPVPSEATGDLLQGQSKPKSKQTSSTFNDINFNNQNGRFVIDNVLNGHVSNENQNASVGLTEASATHSGMEGQVSGGIKMTDHQMVSGTDLGATSDGQGQGKMLNRASSTGDFNMIMTDAFGSVGGQGMHMSNRAGLTGTIVDQGMESVASFGGADRHRTLRLGGVDEQISRQATFTGDTGMKQTEGMAFGGTTENQLVGSSTMDGAIDIKTSGERTLFGDIGTQNTERLDLTTGTKTLNQGADNSLAGKTSSSRLDFGMSSSVDRINNGRNVDIFKKSMTTNETTRGTDRQMKDLSGKRASSGNIRRQLFSEGNIQVGPENMNQQGAGLTTDIIDTASRVPGIDHRGQRPQMDSIVNIDSVQQRTGVNDITKMTAESTGFSGNRRIHRLNPDKASLAGQGMNVLSNANAVMFDSSGIVGPPPEPTKKSTITVEGASILDTGRIGEETGHLKAATRSGFALSGENIVTNVIKGNQKTSGNLDLGDISFKTGLPIVDTSMQNIGKGVRKEKNMNFDSNINNEFGMSVNFEGGKSSINTGNLDTSASQNRGTLSLTDMIIPDLTLDGSQARIVTDKGNRNLDIVSSLGIEANRNTKQQRVTDFVDKNIQKGGVGARVDKVTGVKKGSSSKTGKRIDKKTVKKQQVVSGVDSNTDTVGRQHSVAALQPSSGRQRIFLVRASRPQTVLLSGSTEGSNRGLTISESIQPTAGMTRAPIDQLRRRKEKKAKSSTFDNKIIPEPPVNSLNEVQKSGMALDNAIAAMATSEVIDPLRTQTLRSNGSSASENEFFPSENINSVTSSIVSGTQQRSGTGDSVANEIDAFRNELVKSSLRQGGALADLSATKSTSTKSKTTPSDSNANQETGANVFDGTSLLLSNEIGGKTESTGLGETVSNLLNEAQKILSSTAEITSSHTANTVGGVVDTVKEKVKAPTAKIKKNVTSSSADTSGPGLSSQADTHHLGGSGLVDHSIITVNEGTIIGEAGIQSPSTEILRIEDLIGSPVSAPGFHDLSTTTGFAQETQGTSGISVGKLGHSSGTHFEARGNQIGKDHSSHSFVDTGHGQTMDSHASDISSVVVPDQTIQSGNVGSSDSVERRVDQQHGRSAFASSTQGLDQLASLLDPVGGIMSSSAIADALNNVAVSTGGNKAIDTFGSDVMANNVDVGGSIMGDNFQGISAAGTRDNTLFGTESTSLTGTADTRRTLNLLRNSALGDTSGGVVSKPETSMQVRNTLMDTFIDRTLSGTGASTLSDSIMTDATAGGTATDSRVGSTMFGGFGEHTVSGVAASGGLTENTASGANTMKRLSADGGLRITDTLSDSSVATGKGFGTGTIAMSTSSETSRSNRLGGNVIDFSSNTQRTRPAVSDMMQRHGQVLRGAQATRIQASDNSVGPAPAVRPDHILDLRNVSPRQTDGSVFDMPLGSISQGLSGNAQRLGAVSASSERIDHTISVQRERNMSDSRSGRRVIGRNNIVSTTRQPTATLPLRATNAPDRVNIEEQINSFDLQDIPGRPVLDAGLQMSDGRITPGFRPRRREGLGRRMDGSRFRSQGDRGSGVFRGTSGQRTAGRLEGAFRVVRDPRTGLEERIPTRSVIGERSPGDMRVSRNERVIVQSRGGQSGAGTDRLGPEYFFDMSGGSPESQVTGRTVVRERPSMDRRMDPQGGRMIEIRDIRLEPDRRGASFETGIGQSGEFRIDSVGSERGLRSERRGIMREGMRRPSGRGDFIDRRMAARPTVGSSVLPPSRSMPSGGGFPRVSPFGRAFSPMGPGPITSGPMGSIPFGGGMGPAFGPSLGPGFRPGGMPPPPFPSMGFGPGLF